MDRFYVPTQHPEFWLRLYGHCRACGPHVFERLGEVEKSNAQFEMRNHEHHIWWRQGETFSLRFRYFHDAMAEALPERLRPGWVDQPEFYENVFSCVFWRRDCPSCVAVIPTRVPSPARFLSHGIPFRWVYDERLFAWLRQDARPPAGRPQHDVKKLEFGYGIKPVPTDKLAFVDDGSVQQVRVFKLHRLRGVESAAGEVLHASDTAYYLCHPDRVLAEDGWHPIAVMERYHVGGYYISATVTLAVFVPGQKDVVQLLITLDPWGGRTAVLVAGTRSPEMFFVHYPEQCFLTAKALKVSVIGGG